MARTGYRPSATEAARAKCFECTAEYADGKRDCKVCDCPFHSRTPYKSVPSDYSWLIGPWSRSSEGKPLEEILKKYQHGSRVRIPLSQMRRAKCFRCMVNYDQGGSEKGRIECENRNCPIYYWTPYRKLTPVYDWMFDSSYTKKHRLALSAMGISREEYIKNVLGKGLPGEEEDDEEEDNEETDDDGESDDPGTSPALEQV